VSCDTAKEGGKWAVTYPVLIGYRERISNSCWNLPDGGRHCVPTSYTDYNSPIYRYEQVEYQESLSASLTVYTGQGRLPDPARPAAEDQDGRGAWEIIPYARQKGLDPHRVTRAGAGFTLQVETHYDTDWETKGPAQATAIGGELSGPEKVTAEFYDTRGRLVEIVALERVSGGDTGTAAWQLPAVRHVYRDGVAVQKRWFYTAADIPDGKYQIVARVSGAGLHDLHTCKTAVVDIYGSIYDDVYDGITKP
jgi:hypothetical protein